MKSIYCTLFLLINLSLEAQIPVKKTSLENFADKKIISVTNTISNTESYITTSKSITQSDILEKYISISKAKNDKFLVIQEINRFQYVQGTRKYDSNNQFDREAGVAFVEGVWDFLIRKPVKINYSKDGLPMDTLNDIPSPSYYEALWGYNVKSLNKNFPGVFLSSYPPTNWEVGVTWKDSLSFTNKIYMANNYRVDKVDMNEAVISFESVESPKDMNKVKEPQQRRVVLHGPITLKGTLKINILNNMITSIDANSIIEDYRHNGGNVQVTKQLNEIQLENKLISK